METDPSQGSQEWLPIEETAWLLKRTHWGVRWMVRNNRIKAIRKNRRLLFSAGEILRVIQEGKTAK